MASLDAFLVRATRLTRLGPSQKLAVAGELLNEAVDLLPQHLDRSTEIAMAVGRFATAAEAKTVERFAEAYQQQLSKRLPSEGFSKTQAREAWGRVVLFLERSILPGVFVCFCVGFGLQK